MPSSRQGEPSCGGASRDRLRSRRWCMRSASVDTDAATVLGWYDAIVAAVTDITAGASVGRRRRRGVRAALATPCESSLDRGPCDVARRRGRARRGRFDHDGGRLERGRAPLRRDRDDRRDDRERAAARALCSRRAGSRRPRPGLLHGASRSRCGSSRPRQWSTVTRPRTSSSAARRSAEGELVTVSIAGANRDPATFADPDRFDVRRSNAQLHLAFAQGPHVCLGMHLARLETQTAVRRACLRLPGLRLDPERPSVVRGLVFRKPQTSTCSGGRGDGAG